MPDPAAGTVAMAVYFRVRWKKAGGHYHCRVFSRTAASFNFALLGELVMDENEWPSFQFSTKPTFWEFVPEGE